MMTKNKKKMKTNELLRMIAGIAYALLTVPTITLVYLDPTPVQRILFGTIQMLPFLGLIWVSQTNKTKAFPYFLASASVSSLFIFLVFQKQLNSLINE